MGYYLKGFITNENITNIILTTYKKAVKINLHDQLFLIPMTNELFDEINDLVNSEFVGDFELLNKKINEYIIMLSEYGYIAYVEAEYFGGIGGQSVIAYRNKELICFEEFGENAINKVLKCFGVKRNDNSDEFDTVGLGRHRRVEDWIEDVDSKGD